MMLIFWLMSGLIFLLGAWFGWHFGSIAGYKAAMRRYEGTPEEWKKLIDEETARVREIRSRYALDR